MTVELTPFDPKTASREEWARYHPFRRQREREEEPEDPVLEDRTAEALMHREDPHWAVRRFAVADPRRPDRVVGWLECHTAREGTPGWEENRHVAWVVLEVLEDGRRRGIGRILLERAAALARECGRTLLVTHAYEEDGKAFLRAIGAQEAQRTRQSRLELDRVDWDMVGRWNAEGPARSPTTSLEFHTNLLEAAFLEEYADLMTEVWNLMPRDDLEIGDEVFTPESVRVWVEGIADGGGTKLTALTREADGSLSGVTEMGYFPERGTLIQQYMTGVRTAHRGRGLGKWLKAAMLLRVREAFPEVRVVRTGNAASNAPMLSINERLGFRPHREGIMAQMTVDAVEAYLAEGAA